MKPKIWYHGWARYRNKHRNDLYDNREEIRHHIKILDTIHPHT